MGPFDSLNMVYLVTVSSTKHMMKKKVKFCSNVFYVRLTPRTLNKSFSRLFLY